MARALIFPHPTIAIGVCICPVRMVDSCKGKKGEPFLSRKFISFEGQGWKGNRLSYHLNKGALTKTPSHKDDLVLHDCGNEWCVNPEHLYLGNMRQNVADCYRHLPDMHERLSRGAQRAWSRPERKEQQSKGLTGNQNALGRRWKLSDETKDRMRKGWTDERRAAQAMRMANLNRARAK